MMQGDQYDLPIKLTHENGDPITPSEVDEIEIFVGVVRKTMSDGVIFAPDREYVYVKLTQEETFRMSGETKVQARVMFNSGDVVGVNLGTVNFETSISKVVLK